jgi:hypothetical protein
VKIRAEGNTEKAAYIGDPVTPDPGYTQIITDLVAVVKGPL